VQQNFNYESLNTDNIIEIGWRERMGRRTSFFGVGSSRRVDAFIVKTNYGERFLYVFYGYMLSSPIQLHLVIAAEPVLNLIQEAAIS